MGAQAPVGVPYAPPPQQAPAPAPTQPGVPAAPAPQAPTQSAAPAAAQLQTQPQTQPQSNVAPLSDSTPFELDDASLTELIQIFARRLKINYILDPSVNGNVTIYTYGEVRAIDEMPLLETILRINGFAMVKVGIFTGSFQPVRFQSSPWSLLSTPTPRRFRTMNA